MTGPDGAYAIREAAMAARAETHTPLRFSGVCRRHETVFETADAELFTAHAFTEHGVKPGQWISGGRMSANYGPARGYPRVKPGREGAPYSPTGIELGSTVTWEETSHLVVAGDSGVEFVRVRRSGQVWCAAPRPKSVWVVPFEPHWPGEAVQLEVDRLGEVQMTGRTPARAVDAEAAV